MQIYLFVYIDILLLAEITMEIESVGTVQVSTNEANVENIVEQNYHS